MEQNNLRQLIEKFKSHFGDGGNIRPFFAPGRVNLIGEHIDYNGGFVFPAALSLGITALARSNGSKTIRMLSLNVPGEVKVDFDKEIEYKEGEWGNYPKGVFKYLLEEGYQLTGCDILYNSTLPEGAGLSSSAALEVLTTFLMVNMIGEKMDKVKMAQFSQFVENNFVKMNCGIMDQFSVAMGKENGAILLDCNTLQYSYVPLDLKDYTLVIINSNKKRELTDSKYNERRGECEKALFLINQHEKVDNLCNATFGQIEQYVKDDILLKRARHVVSENRRVLEAVKALERGDLLQMGLLMTQSHLSLKYDYEVTGFELDTLVEEALKFDGCIGARMTGAGFGGCAIALVRSSLVEAFKQKVAHFYQNKTSLICAFYESKIGNGVREIAMEVTTKKSHV